MRVRKTTGTRRTQPLLRVGSSTLAAFLAILVASTARGDGVGVITVAKTLPPATVAVIDPESGTSSGGGSTDVRIATGDIILFRFRYMPIAQSQLGGINGWLTEYVPPNLQVVGVRLMDEDGLTVTPNLPGLAEDGTAVMANSWGGITCAGATCPVADGGISQLYGDTGVFFSTDPRTARTPSNALITLANGTLLVAPTPQAIRGDSNLRAALGVVAPFYAHNAWDWAQAQVFGANDGNTPHLYGSPVAGPDTHYRYEVTNNAGALQFRSQVGPWQRVQYPGSTIATGDAATSTNGSGMGRTILDASTRGHDLTPNNPLPHVGDGDPASATAVRVAVGEVRAGDPLYVEVAFRVMGTPLDPGFGTMGGDVNCGESFGGDVSGALTSQRAENNPWGYFVPSPACVFLNLLFDITADSLIHNNDDTAGYDDVQLTMRTRNLSLNPRNNVWIRQKYNPMRVALADTIPAFPDGAPTCSISNCDGDGYACLFWSVGTVDPSEEITIRTNLEVSNGGDPTTPIRADFTSDDLGTRSGNPCAGGSITSPGYRTQEAIQIRSLAILRATLADSAAAAGGVAPLSGTISVEGTQNLTVDDVWVELPAGWTVANTGGPGTPDITVAGTRYECSAGCTTERPRFDGVNASIAQGVSRPITFSVNVPATSPDNYPIALQLWSSQSGYGGKQETYFRDLAVVSVGRPRSLPPVLDCPILSSWTTIPGSTTEADGTIIRVYFNGVERGDDPSSAGRFAVGGWSGAAGTFGALYGGLEVRATAQAPFENESELSTACFVTQVSACQDGVDNDGDGLIDFPADPGCSEPGDGDEGDPECADGAAGAK